MTADVDVLVIGAGVIGLAVARELALDGKSILVLEKAEAIGTETSTRNSEVIHAGIYYPQGSLKAWACVEGKELLYSYCQSRGVPHKRIGKLIVATSAEEEVKLESIHALATKNGVTDLQWLSESVAKEREPDVRCTKALFSPSTGIVDAKAYMLSLQGEIESQGGSIAFRTAFLSAVRRGNVFTVTAKDDSGEITALTANMIVNCAGHGAHAAAVAAGCSTAGLPPRFLAKGNYCSVTGRSPFKHLVYPVPVSGALGIHATLDLGGAVRFGPDITWVDDIDYTTSEGLPEKFASAVESYWPAVRDRELSPSYCGIRPKIHGPDQGFADFMIQVETQHGISGLVNLFGIESPGLTATLAIAKNVAKGL